MVPISTLLQKLQLIKQMVFDRKKLGDRGLGDRLGWVVRITPYAQFCPIPPPFYLGNEFLYSNSKSSFKAINRELAPCF